MTIPFKTTEHVASRREWLAYYVRRAGSYALGFGGDRAVNARVAVVCEPRTGSELLCRSLARTYGARYDGEIFTTPSLHPALYCRGRANLAARQKRGYVCKLMTRHLREGLHYINGPTLLRRLHAAGFAFVRLERRDKIAEAVSALRSLTVGIWHQRAGSSPTDRVEVRIEDLITALTLNELNATWWSWAAEGLPVHHVSYEDDLSSPEGLVRTVGEIGNTARLGRPPAERIDSPLVRTSVGGWRDAVTNADVVEAALRRSRFAHLLSVP